MSSGSKKGTKKLPPRLLAKYTHREIYLTAAQLREVWGWETCQYFVAISNKPVFPSRKTKAKH